MADPVGTKRWLKDFCKICGAKCDGRTCRMCYRKHILPQRVQNQIGSKNPRWKGGIKNADGYIKILVGVTVHNGVRARRYKGEHRIVMEKILGRELTQKEQVHHRDGNRSNNSPENLELRSGPHGIGATKHCPTCTCGGNNHAI